MSKKNSNALLWLAGGAGALWLLSRQQPASAGVGKVRGSLAKKLRTDQFVAEDAALQDFLNQYGVTNAHMAVGRRGLAATFDVPMKMYSTPFGQPGSPTELITLAESVARKHGVAIYDVFLDKGPNSLRAVVYFNARGLGSLRPGEQAREKEVYSNPLLAQRLFNSAPRATAQGFVRIGNIYDDEG